MSAHNLQHNRGVFRRKFSNMKKYILSKKIEKSHFFIVEKLFLFGCFIVLIL